MILCFKICLHMYVTYIHKRSSPFCNYIQMGTYTCLDDKIHYHNKSHQNNNPIYLLIKNINVSKNKITYRQCQLTSASACAVDTKVFLNINATTITTIIIAVFDIVHIITKPITNPQSLSSPS